MLAMKWQLRLAAIGLTVSRMISPPTAARCAGLPGGLRAGEGAELGEYGYGFGAQSR
jgi:hypothetical protein